MDNITKYLKNWAVTFLKNKDIISKKIVEITDNESKPEFIIRYKDKEQLFYICPELNPFFLEQSNKEESLGIFVYHTKHNFEILMERWNDISKIRRLTLYFVNPFSNLENKWIIQPYNHSKIADKASFKLGMKSMFSSVNPVLEQDLKRITD